MTDEMDCNSCVVTDLEDQECDVCHAEQVREPAQEHPSALIGLLARALCKADTLGYERGFTDADPTAGNTDDALMEVVEMTWKEWIEDAEQVLRAC